MLPLSTVAGLVGLAAGTVAPREFTVFSAGDWTRVRSTLLVDLCAVEPFAVLLVLPGELGR